MDQGSCAAPVLAQVAQTDAGLEEAVTGEDDEKPDIFNSDFKGVVTSIALHADEATLNSICHRVREQKQFKKDSPQGCRVSIWPKEKDCVIRTFYDTVDGIFNKNGMRFSVDGREQVLLEMFVSDRRAYPTRYLDQMNEVSPERADMTSYVRDKDEVVETFNLLGDPADEVKSYEELIRVAMVPLYSLVTDVRRFEIENLVTRVWMEINDSYVLQSPAGLPDPGWSQTEIRQKGDLNSKIRFRIIQLKTTTRRKGLAVDCSPYLVRIAKRLNLGDPLLSPSLLHAFSYCNDFGRKYCRSLGREELRCEKQARIELTMNEKIHETVFTSASYVHELQFSCLHGKEIGMLVRIPPGTFTGKRCYSKGCTERAKKLRGQVELLISSAALKREKALLNQPD